MTAVRLAIVLTLLTGLGACSSSSSSPPAPDAMQTGAACTGVVYDACTDNTQCMSQNCHLYNANALQICTQPCSATVACPPDSTGAAVQCNMMGNCKPAVANTCHR